MLTAAATRSGTTTSTKSLSDGRASGVSSQASRTRYSSGAGAGAFPGVGCT